MTRKKRQEASHRMKQIWAKRKALKDLNKSATEYAAAKPMDSEVGKLIEIIDLMDGLSAAGRQYLVNRFM